MGTLHRVDTTRWSSHFESICGLIDMYDAIISVFECMVNEGSSNTIREKTGGSLMAMKSFDFIFILHLMHKIIGITNMLCWALRHKSLNILNAMNLVSSTKSLLQTLRAEGFDYLLHHVKSVCMKFDVGIPDMSTQYKGSRRSCQQNDNITVDHHYHMDLFNATIDHQLEELHSRFNEKTMELFMLSSALDPRDNFKSFNPDRICLLVEKFSAADFDRQDMHHLKCQLYHYQFDVVRNERF
ncbi:unnamed protein product [Ilex paraguariensis]|uniref:Uncharacterized protein n=1 Tax=Ilex paraguariensis TaxID=185542 RepID=A0ABC8UG09_9AQUA